MITDALSIELDDLVIHMDHGIGKFRGFELVKADNVAHECLILEYAENSRLFLPVENINLLSRYGQSNSILDKLGGVAWQKRKSPRVAEASHTELQRLVTSNDFFEN